MSVCQIMMQNFLSDGKLGRQITDPRDIKALGHDQYYTDTDLIEGINYYLLVKESGLSKDDFYDTKPDHFISWANKQLGGKR